MSPLAETPLRGNARLFDFAIIGAQKSSSTWLQECLREHPSIWMPKYEVYAFEDPYHDASAVEALHDQLNRNRGPRVVGIKCPSYLGRPECPERLYQYAPDARFIVCLRNPIERAVSAYFHYMVYGAIPVAPIEDGLARILDGKFREDFPRSVDIIEFGMYAKHLDRYMRLYSRHQFHVITDVAPFDDRRLRSVFTFVGVDPGYQPKSRIKRVNEGVYSLSRIEFLRAKNRLAHRSDRALRKPGVWPWFVDRTMLVADRAILRWALTSAKPRPSEGLRRRLYDHYRHDIARLETMLGEDLAAWKLGESAQCVH
jgi:Sulfotransferase domain